MASLPAIMGLGGPREGVRNVALIGPAGAACRGVVSVPIEPRTYFSPTAAQKLRTHRSLVAPAACRDRMSPISALAGIPGAPSEAFSGSLRRPRVMGHNGSRPNGV
eukprot:scaffold1766_cov401-Prasinococcus_capsulatus_cf.AAC.7